MAGSVNKVIILGNVGSDPETKRFNNGGSVTNFSVATSETWRDKSSGEKQERTEWHRIAIFSDVLGEIVRKYARKGDKIYIEGQLQTRKWTDKDDVERYSTEIVVKGYNCTINLIGRVENRSGNGRDRDGEARGNSRNSDQPEHRRAAADLDDEIPF